MKMAKRYSNNSTNSFPHRQKVYQQQPFSGHPSGSSGSGSIHYLGATSANNYLTKDDEPDKSLIPVIFNIQNEMLRLRSAVEEIQNALITLGQQKVPVATNRTTAKVEKKGFIVNNVPTQEQIDHYFETLPLKYLEPINTDQSAFTKLGTIV